MISFRGIKTCAGHTNAGVISRQAGPQGGGGVAVHQDDVGRPLFVDVAHAQQHVAGDVAEVLARLHQVQVEVGFQCKQV